MSMANTCKYLFGIIASIMIAGNITGARAQTYFPSDVDTSTCNFSESDFQEWTKLELPFHKINPNLPNIPFGPVYDKTTGMVYVFPPNGPSFKTDNTSPPFKLSLL